MLDFAKPNPRVLIIDDDAAVRLLVRDTLEESGFVVEEAELGSEGMRLFGSFSPDIVLLDVLLPDCDGCAVCADIRRSSQGGELIPIVMITALEDIKSINQAYACGATDFITKPIHWTLLTHRLRYMLRVSALSHQLAQKEHMLINAQRIAHLGSWEFILANEHFACSEEMRRIFGLPSDSPTTLQEMLSQVHEADRERLVPLIQQARRGQPFATEHRVSAAGATLRTVHHQVEIEKRGDGSPWALTGTVQDITQRQQAEERIRYLAYHDQLTGFANRILFRELVEKALAVAARQRSKCALMLLDVDDFKRINDSYGHSAGDIVLKEFAERLRRCLRDSDTVARKSQLPNDEPVNLSRLGGDEFTILLNGIESAETAAFVAQRIVNAMVTPLYVDGREVHVTTSIGIACFPQDGHDVDSLIRHADAAMYAAKRQGKNLYSMYMPEATAKT